MTSETTFLQRLLEKQDKGLLNIIAKRTKVNTLTPDSSFFPYTGKIKITVLEIEEHRQTLARKNFVAWMEKTGLEYHSFHKFRHGHIQYGLAHSKTHADFKAVSLNVMHSNIQITDQFYSNIPDNEVQDRINAL